MNAKQIEVLGFAENHLKAATALLAALHFLTNHVYQARHVITCAIEDDSASRLYLAVAELDSVRAVCANKTAARNLGMAVELIEDAIDFDGSI